MLLKKRIKFPEFTGYVIAQVIGAIAGAALLKLIVFFGIADQTGALGSNGIVNVGITGAIVVEIILTAIFVLTVLGVTSDKNKGNIAGIVIGLTLAFVHIVGIPLTGTSVNPARSFGPALLAGGENLSNVWIFIVAPLVGAIIAAALFSLWEEKKTSPAKPNTGKKKRR